MDMNRKLKFSIICVLSMMLFFTSCGDVNDGKGESPVVLDPNFKAADCEIDSDKLTKIFTEEISSEINCVYSQLNLLINLVKSEDPSLGDKNISRAVLEEFINAQIPNADQFLDYFDLFFTLNSFIFGNAENLVVSNDFRRLKDFMLVANKEISGVYKYLKALDGKDKISIKIHTSIRDRLIKKAAEVVFKTARNDRGEDVSLLGLLDSKSNTVRKLLVSEFIDYFENDENKDGIEITKDLSFLKKVFLGGNNEELLNTELKTFLQANYLDLVETVYDIYRLPNLSFDNEVKKFNLYSKSIQSLKSFFFVGVDPDAPLISFQDIFKVLGRFQKDLLGEYSVLDFSIYEWELARIKEAILGNNSKYFSLNDLLGFINIAETAVEQGEGYAEIFKENRDVLVGNKERITDISLLKNPLGDEGKVVFQKFFQKINTYRYYTGSGIIPRYGDEFERNIDGLVYNGLWESVFNKVISFYETSYPCHEDKAYPIFNTLTGKIDFVKRYDAIICSSGEDFNQTVHAGQIYYFILEFRRVLSDLGILKLSREDSLAENASLVPDLFLYASNDDGVVRDVELVSFLNVLFSGIKIKSDLFNYIKDQCEPTLLDPITNEPKYSPKCVRDHFVDSLKSTQFDPDQGVTFSYMDFFPKLEANISQIEREDEDTSRIRKYLLLLEKYARSCGPADNLAMNESDYLSYLSGIMIIEQTVGKFDSNKNNIIDSSEAEIAFDHFRPALEAIIGRDYLKFATKTIFKFLLTYKRVPEVSVSLGGLGDTGKLLALIPKKMPSIDREAIVSILVTLQKEGDKKKQLRLGDAYESSDDFCSRTRGVSRIINDEWACYVENNAESCALIKD